MIRCSLVLAIIACGDAALFAQLPQARLYSVFPPGVASGQITELRVNTGADLDEADQLLFSHPGIFATQKRQAGGDGRMQPVTNVFRVAVDDSVPAGRYEVRAVGRFGTSNPRPLLVSARPSVAESEPNNDASRALQIDKGIAVDGQINGAGDVDFVRVAAKRGDRLVVDCLAERIDSRLNPALTLADQDGRPVAFSENVYGRDPFLLFDVPADGDYLIQVHDETFAGGSEYLYRLQVHTEPHVRFVMPPAGVPGTTGQFTLYGYNLPGGERLDSSTGKAPLERLDVQIAVPKLAASLAGTSSVGAGLDAFTYRFSSAAGTSNAVRIGLASESTPVVLEQEPNGDAHAAQPLTVPVEVGGQFAETFDVDVYTFEAKKGQVFWIEVVGQRAGVRLDPYLRVEHVKIDDSGNEQPKELTKQDDVGTNLAANVFDTATDDPVYQLKVPEDGTYRVTLRDRAFEHRGDPSLVYRLVIRSAEPDFRLVAVPSGSPSGQTWPAGLRRGDHFSLDVLAFRRDGFNGPIEIRPRALPAGVTTQGTIVREKETRATLVLTAAESAPIESSVVDLVGSARVDSPTGEQLVQRPVRFGGVVWSRNGNVPAVSQLESEFSLAVIPEAAPFQVTHSAEPLTVHQGRQLLIPLTILKRGFDEKLTLKFDGIPKSAKIDKQDLTFEKGKTDQTLRLFVRADSPPSTYVVAGTATASVPYRRNPEKADRLAAEKDLAVGQAQIAKAAADEAAAQLKALSAAFEKADAQFQQVEKSIQAALKQRDESQRAVDQAKQQLEQSSKKVASLAQEAEQTATAAAESAKAVDESEAPEAKTKADNAQKAADEKQTALKTAQQEHSEAKERLEATQAAAATAQETLTKAQQQRTSTQASRQSAEVLKSAAERRNTAAAEAAKQAEQALKAAEKAATDAVNAAKAKNVNVTQPIPPFLITVKPAPIKLEAKPTKAEVKQGGTVDVAVTVKRQNSFAGPVKLTLFLPDGVTELSAEEVSVAADADSAVLKVTAKADAADGDVANLCVRGVADSGGEAVVDFPISLKVAK